MASKHPTLKHVRWVTTKGTLYAYFNTGKKKPNGRPIYAPLPPHKSVGFYDSYAAMVGARTKREKVEYTVADLARDFEKSSAFTDLAGNTQEVYSRTLRRVVALLGKFPVMGLERDHIQLILDNEAMGPGAQNMLVAVIGAMYTWRRSRDQKTPRPTEGIPLRKGSEHEPWPDDIMEAALESDDDLVSLAAHLLLFTGQRIGDALKMRWSDIRDGELIYVKQQKTAKELWIPFLDELRQRLGRTPKRGLFIVAKKNGKPYSVETIRRKLQEFTEAMGTETVPHGVRKNAVNAFLEAGCSVAEVSSITGQSYKVVEHYAKRINQKNMAKAAVIKLENRRKTRKPDAKHG